MATAASLGLDAHQFGNAQGIIRAVKRRGWSSRAAVIAVETALAESGMRMIASANVPRSVDYAHVRLSWTSDGLGHDHASCGMFQQQTGWAWSLPGTSTMGSANGWGTPAELMDPEKSTAKFLDALARVNWQYGYRWAAAQAVQRSAFPDGRNYRTQDLWAQQIVNALWTAVSTGGGHSTDSGSTKPIIATRSGKYVVRSGDTLGSIAARHHTTWKALAKLNNLANPNLIRIGQTLRVPVAAGTVKGITSTTKYRVVGHYTVRAGDTLIGICHKYPQSWITPASVARLNRMTNPNHLYVGQILRIGG